MAGKAARGAGTIRKKTVTRSGKTYTYWEARVTTGRDPGTGKQVQISITGKTQKEVREKMQAATVAVDNGTYIQPERMTVGEWLDIWTAEYLGGVKPNTVRIYRNNVKRHIKPALGAVRLPELRPHMIQAFINRLELAPASVRLAYKVLYQALKKAVTLHYIPQNPAEGCTLPRLEQEEIKPMDDKQITALLNAARGTEVEQLITTALFTGCRLSELLGLTWDCVGRDTITISKQLARPDQRVDGPFISPKNGKSRTLMPAPLVLDALKADGIPVSLDSYQPATQAYALSRGVAYLNDIRGFPDAAFYPQLAKSSAKLVVMHSVQDGQADRREAPAGDIMDHIAAFFDARIAALTGAGIKRNRLVLDPGMGFFLGAAPETSLSVLARFDELRLRFDLPVLLSVSRKSFLRALTGRGPGDVGAATLAAELAAAAGGADFIRTHEPRPLRDGLAVLAALKETARIR